MGDTENTGAVTPAFFPAFEPGKYITKVNGGDYLEVKWRLVWLRTEHADAEVETELITNDGHQAVCRARVSIPGGGSATGWGSETVDDFRDYIEKAETKALGRALAALGFGTQFAPDHDHGVATGRIADSPVRRDAGQDSAPSFSAGGAEATSKQVAFIYRLAHDAGFTDAEISRVAATRYGSAIERLKRSQASALIEALRNGEVTYSEAQDTQEPVDTSEADSRLSDDPGDFADDLAPAEEYTWETQPITQEQWTHERKRASDAGWTADDLLAFIAGCGVTRAGELTYAHLVSMRELLDAGQRPRAG